MLHPRVRVRVRVRVINVARASHFVPADFLSAEAMGVEMPRRCASCKKCKECQFRTSMLTFKENAEYEAILDNLSYDPEDKKWTAAYPFAIDPQILQDNKFQAVACMKSQEKRLVKQKRMEEFNKVFQETVDRGVFKKLTSEEMEEWKGPVNYISMVEAFKQGPQATTPIRICMNSSMKQPPPTSKSLNDLLMKGPPALADLFAVSLGMREYRYALIKDLSKFYNCVLADETAQHVRRIVWRFGSTEKAPDVYVTTTVNFGDKPAGCIAIAAVRETAAKFGAGKEEAVWFLQNRTYVDDCTAGSNSKEELLVISEDLEKIVQEGGFKFKDTVMTGDPLKDNEKVKVLGMLWDTAKDTFAIDVKINHGGKKKGAKLLPDMDLEEEAVENYLPVDISKRIIWRVVQSQYDPLGLISPYTIQLKIVMRDLCSEEGKIEWDQPVPVHIADKTEKHWLA